VVGEQKSWVICACAVWDGIANDTFGVTLITEYLPHGCQTCLLAATVNLGKRGEDFNAISSTG
jgi:hypothetical protein